MFFIDWLFYFFSPTYNFLVDRLFKNWSNQKTITRESDTTTTQTPQLNKTEFTPIRVNSQFVRYPLSLLDSPNSHPELTIFVTCISISVYILWRLTKLLLSKKSTASSPGPEDTTERNMEGKRQGGKKDQSLEPRSSNMTIRNTETKERTKTIESGSGSKISVQERLKLEKEFTAEDVGVSPEDLEELNRLIAKDPTLNMEMTKLRLAISCC